MIFILCLVYIFKINSKYIAVLKEVPFERIFHYQLLMIAGVVIGFNKSQISFSTHFLFSLILSLISLCFLALFAMINNNLADLKIDKISNHNRALAKGVINIETYSKLQYPCLFIGLAISSFVSFKIFFFNLLGAGNYYLYSTPPIRIKRITYLSKGIIALNSLIMVLAGYTLVTGSLKNFPHIISAFLLFIFINPMQFIDIKDYEGDKKYGIRTFPVLVGLKKSKIIIGISFIIAYLSCFFILKEACLLLPLFVMGSLQFYLINKKKYNEKPVFLLYLVSLILFIVYIWGAGVQF
ncbi:MAG: UbiA family prenyltransferase [bacterium]|nr:UbiA family prenyltransferase [bacterium]